MRNQNKKIFVLGTDTDVGKTIVSAAIANGLSDTIKMVGYYKPVQTGGRDIDASCVRDLAPDVKVYSSTYTYPDPLSPDQAAFLAKAPEVDLSKIIDEIQNFNDDYLIIEGAGGLWVPLNSQGQTWLDFLKEVNCKIVLVSRTTLGTINHTISTVHSLITNGLHPDVIVMNGSDGELNKKSIENLVLNLSSDKLPILDFPKCDLSGSDDFRKISVDLASKLIPIIDGFNEQVQDLLSADIEYCWHPYTRYRSNTEILEVEKSRGLYLYTKDGEKLLDATGSWWVNTIGHGHPKIARAISSQQAKLDHVIFANATHEPAVMLAKKVLDFCDFKNGRVFFSDNGSCAVEIALKMCFQMWSLRGQSERRTFLALNGSYHGDTVGCMSIGGAQEFHHIFSDLLFKSKFFIPKLAHSTQNPLWSNLDKQVHDQIFEYIDRNHQEVCALVLEPLIQGAGGMLMHDVEWLKRLCVFARSKGIPVVFDEVFTGMGRTGAPTASQKMDFKPDLLCLAKGLTGGNLPLALTLVQNSIFQEFHGEEVRQNIFLHGHSFTANPISCAAALATLDIYNDQKILDRVPYIENVYDQWKHSMCDDYYLRALGSVMAFELRTDSPSYFNDLGKRFCERLRGKGLLLRPLGQTIYLCPPLVIELDELKNCLDKIQTELSHFDIF